MKGFNVLGTNHTSFTVSNLERSIAIFCKGLDFKLVSKAPRDPGIISQVTGLPEVDIVIAYLVGHGHQVELIQYLKPEDRKVVKPRPCDVGFAHIAFDVDDIASAVMKMEEFQVVPMGPPIEIDKGPNKGNKVAYLRDADGLTIEFIEKPKING